MSYRIKLNYISHVSADYVADGSRTFHFALCRRFKGQLESHAVCTLKDGVVKAMRVTPALEGHQKGIEKLARIYQTRSLPQQLP